MALHKVLAVGYRPFTFIYEAMMNNFNQKKIKSCFRVSGTTRFQLVLFGTVQERTFNKVPGETTV
jgi:hypothetical protein